MSQHILLTGYVGADATIKSFETGSKVASFSFAVSESYKPKGSEEYKTHTEWFNVVAWNNKASYAEKVAKTGSHLQIEGKLRTRKYEDKEGKMNYVQEYIVTNIIPLHVKKQEVTPPQVDYPEPTDQDDPTEDLPF